MKESGEPDFIYYVFDLYQHQGYYQERVVDLDKIPKPRPACIKLLKPTIVYDAEGFMKYWNKCVNDGFEGVIARRGTVYFNGRSTSTVGGMGKYKHFQDDEAEIIGFEEMCTNTNPKKTNAHGRSERGSAKAGKVPNGRMGKWLCRDLKTGIEFSCGTMLGVTLKQRKEWWDNRQIYIGWIIKYKHQPSGETAKPRFPVFLGFRHKDDI
jgi:DNA ligase-1